MFPPVMHPLADRRDGEMLRISEIAVLKLARQLPYFALA